MFSYLTFYVKISVKILSVLSVLMFYKLITIDNMLFLI